LRYLAAIAILAVASPAFADDKPDKLQPTEIASGELMLFDYETLFGWKTEGEATVKDGWMVLGGTKATTATCTTSFPASFIKLQLDFPADLPDAKRPRFSL